MRVESYGYEINEENESTTIFQAMLPPPPGVNRTYGVARSGHWYMSDRARQWEQDAMLALRASGFRTQPAGVYWIAVELVLYSISLDIDAPIKLVLDTVEAALGIDDRWIGRLSVVKVPVPHRTEQQLQVVTSLLPVRDREEWQALSLCAVDLAVRHVEP